ncbi:hypothetical protein OAD28_07835 [Flavobacteriales bacterium]|nr:hypothetical protein [Flavobacteriales bacterium]
MKLLRIEYKKIVGNKSFKVFTIMFLVFLPLLVFLVPSMIKFPFQGLEFHPLIPINYQTSWYAVTLISSWFCFFLLSFVLIYHITNEYNYRTVRQNIIDGFTRNDYLLGKLYLMLAITILATLYVLIIGIAGGLYFSTFEQQEDNVIQEFFKLGAESDVQAGFGSLFDGISNVLRFFVQTLATFSFAFLIAFLTKRGILAVLVFYASFIAEKIARWQFSENGMDVIADYFPLHNIANTLPFPGMTSLITGINSPMFINWTYLGLSMIYAVVFIFLTRLVFYKRDIS